MSAADPGPRVETRTRDTGACPSSQHRHTWAHHRRSKVVTYDADERGRVVLTEEAVAQLLRAAGYQPDPS